MIKGQIVREYGQTLEVESNQQIYECFARKNMDSTVVGDFVEFDWNEAAKSGVITRRLPRKNVLCRSDRYHPIKEMAANTDQIVILFAPLPEPNEFYLDQYLAAAALIDVPALLLLNKVDLKIEAPLLKLKQFYESIGYPVIEVSAKTGEGVDQVLQKLSGKTSFLLGPSGVGKSSLINALLGSDVARVQTVSKSTQKGQHTTSVSCLYHLQNGGAIIDVPGIRELNLPASFKESLIKGFVEFRPFLGSCRFRNCAHRDDPGCIVLEKVKAGELSETRLKNYYRMLDGQ